MKGEKLIVKINNKVHSSVQCHCMVTVIMLRMKEDITAKLVLDIFHE